VNYRVQIQSSLSPKSTGEMVASQDYTRKCIGVADEWH
jgi:hypothetical protein